MISEEDYQGWGEEIFNDAKEVYEMQQKHLILVHQIIEYLISKYKHKKVYFDNLTYVRFCSFTYTGTSNGPKELRDYWLNFIIKQNPWFDKSLSIEIGAKNILDSLFERSIIKEFNKNAHFYENKNFKFILNKGQWGTENVNIRVPFSLNYAQIEFAIHIIEKLTNCCVSKISLWYFTYDLSVDMYSEIYFALDDRIDKHEGHPFISKSRFLEQEIKSHKNWYKEFSEFKKYIHDIDSNTFSCVSCGISIYDSEGSVYWWCEICTHYVDREGNCVSDDCVTCENQILVDVSPSNDNIDFACITCGNTRVVSDHIAPYWWCSDCEHWIDQDGHPLSEDSEKNDDSYELDNYNEPFYLFFDSETTGVPKDWKAPITNFDNWPRIIQLAWLVYDCKGNQISKNEYIIKPNGFEIPLASSNIHGISTQYALEVGVSIDEVLLKFEKHCEQSKYLIAHNINFDAKVTGSEFLRILSRNPISNLEHLCTMESSTNFCKIHGNFGYKWPKLSELHIKLFGVDFEGAHNALADIEATAKCFWEMRRLKLI